MFKALEQLSLTLVMMVMTGKDDVSSPPEYPKSYHNVHASDFWNGERFVSS